MLPTYQVLSESEIEKVHETSLSVLEKTGVAVNHPKAQEVLVSLGAKISADRQRLFFPPNLVEKMLLRAPKEFLCAARKPEYDLTMKQGNHYARQGGGPMWHIDLASGKTRDITLNDAIDSARLINMLPHINAPSTISPQDVDPKTYDILTVKTMLEHTHKHFWALTTGADHLKYELELAAASVGGKENLAKRPILSGVYCVIAPLRFPDDEIDRLILCGEYGVNVMTPITVLIGGSAPYTLAGSLTQMNAEFLASIVIGQALCPGIGQWYYTLVQNLEMQTGRSLSHGPEIMLIYAAGAALGRYYGIPTLANTLLSGDVKPEQALYHYSQNALLGLLNDVTFQAGAGSLDCGNLYSPQSLVLINEMLDSQKRFKQGIDINEETLAFDDIHQTAAKGEYISSKLTMKYLRKEKRHVPEIIDFPNLASWQEKPQNLYERAANKVAQLLAIAPSDPVLDNDTQQELNKIMNQAQKTFY